MGSHAYDITETSTAPVDVVFAVLADAPGWSRWNRSIARASWEVQGDPAPGGVGAVRALGAAKGPLSRERIVAFDPPRHLAYVIDSGPMPVRGYRADIRLGPAPDGGTTIHWVGSWSTRVPWVSGFLTRTVRGFAIGAAREAERIWTEPRPEAPS
ncbi:MAG: SRPBCC family protein [Acidimicrobiia bacterium]|nr:SRPBCC family protein [Acidimicrobiia bacterium]